MADTLTTQSATPATVPDGTVIATDDAGAAGQVQIVKLALSTDGSATPIAADANGLEVQGAGTAGTAAGGVLTVQGAATGTPVPVDGSGATQPVSAASLPLPTGAATAAHQVTQNGYLDGVETLLAGGLPAALAAGGGLKVEGIAGGVEVPVSLATVPSHAVTNAGTFATQVNGDALTALQLIDNPVNVDDAAYAPGTGSVMAVGMLADETAPDSVDEGDIGIPRITLDRFQQVVASLESSAMRIAGVAVTPKFVIIDAATSGDNTLLAAVASKKIRVLAAFLVAAGAVNARFESGAAGTALTGQMNLTSNSGFTLPFSPVGWFETASNTLLNLELSGAVSVDGALVYIEV